ncbi:MAG: ABC transporter permease, partial [Alphaproteobacteria bacterium]|nr:ABC transporter permease [Alphaproteobacteria bacterium]
MAVTSPPIPAPALPSRLSFKWLKGFPAIPVLILLLIAFVAIFADVLAPYDPQIGSLSHRYRPPAWQDGGSMAHILGTDHVGRDELSRLIFGARVSMIVG